MSEGLKEAFEKMRSSRMNRRERRYLMRRMIKGQPRIVCKGINTYRTMLWKADERLEDLKEYARKRNSEIMREKARKIVPGYGL